MNEGQITSNIVLNIVWTALHSVWNILNIFASICCQHGHSHHFLQILCCCHVVSSSNNPSMSTVWFVFIVKFLLAGAIRAWKFDASFSNAIPIQGIEYRQIYLINNITSFVIFPTSLLRQRHLCHLVRLHSNLFHSVCEKNDLKWIAYTQEKLPIPFMCQPIWIFAMGSDTWRVCVRSMDVHQSLFSFNI